MTETSRKSFFSRFGRWIAELLLVFVGAYGAFWLNGYPERQRDMKRRDIILESLEESVKNELANAQQNAGAQEKRASDFRRALDAGEMPQVRPFSFQADYSPSDIATLLQAGGVELLDPKTLTAIRDTESVIRGGLALMAHYQHLSDELIYPNLDKGNVFFYDPTTKKLKPSVEKYPESLEQAARFFREMEKSERELLHQLQAERHRDSREKGRELLVDVDSSANLRQWRMLSS